MRLAEGRIVWLNPDVTVTLRQHLESLNGDVLRGLLKKLGIEQKGLTRKEQFADAIERQLTGSLASVLLTLSEAERLWLADSVHQGRFVSQVEFEAKFGGQWPWRRSNDSWSNRREPSALEAMVHWDGQTRERFVLGALVTPLKACLEKPAGASLKTVQQLPLDTHKYLGSDGKPLQVFESERIAPAELSRVLRLIQAGKVRVTDAGRRPTDGTARLVGEVLVAPDFALEAPAEAKKAWREDETSGPVRAHAWPVLVQQCGWAKPKGSALTLTSSGQEMLHGFNAEQYRAGVARFISDGDFDELHRVNHIRGQTGKAKHWITDPGLRRSAVREVLAQWPAGEWMTYDEACRSVNASGKEWDVIKQDGFLYLCDAQYGAIYERPGVNSQFLRALLMESLATLGLVDIAFVHPHFEGRDLRGHWGADQHSFLGRYDGLRYVRLTPLGGFCFRVTESYSLAIEARSKCFRVLPNHELVLTEAHLDPASRAMLELVAAPKTETVWALDSERILTHVETGGTLKELREFLEANALDGLPENVRVFLAELEARLGACRSARAAVLLEWQDEALARLIATSTGLMKLCSHAGGTRLVVAETDYPAFARLVKKLGFVAPRRAAGRARATTLKSLKSDNLD